ncbi:MAG: acyl-CoA dehydrogenase family protein, partial [Pseudomonadota bacterium]|nr:acyl-CoA dehydrogenase family protein [Pseudomonadota bacterium]
MDLSLPEEIVALKATVTRLFEREVLPVMDGYEDRAQFPRPLIESLGNAGLFGAAFPEALGGSAMGFLAV